MSVAYNGEIRQGNACKSKKTWGSINSAVDSIQSINLMYITKKDSTKMCIQIIKISWFLMTIIIFFILLKVPNPQCNDTSLEDR